MSYFSVLAGLLLIGAGGAVRAEPRAARAQAAAEGGDKGGDKGGDETLDQKAKRLFAAGRYREAIEILARLYAQTSNPIYLRNIGRCYQRLPDPDRAIGAFQEYLLRGHNISRAEREEVRGFIRELEDTKARNAEAARPPVEPARPPTPVPATGTTETSPAAPAPAPVTVEPPPVAAPLVAPATFGPVERPTPPPAAAPGRTARLLAVGAMGLAGALAITGGVVMATSWSRYRSAEKTCLLRGTCLESARTVDSRNTTAKILLIGAAVTGAAGVAVYLLAPGRRGEGAGLALGMGGRF